MSESIDETLDKDEAEEETVELTNQVLDEIGVDIASQGWRRRLTHFHGNFRDSGWCIRVFDQLLYSYLQLQKVGLVQGKLKMSDSRRKIQDVRDDIVGYLHDYLFEHDLILAR
ncbi:hypothetical protein QQ045_019870 [Rhodiola kirilowii]